MQVLVVGCGRVGSAVIAQLIQAGQDVVVIESDPAQLARIQHLDCETFVGSPIDIKFLTAAGIEQCEAFLGLSDQENINVMSAQIARQFFNVPHCVIRIFNPDNEAAYQAMGLETISQTAMVTDQILERLGFVPAEDHTTVLGYPVRYDLFDTPASWWNKRVMDLAARHNVHILASITGSGFRIVRPQDLIQEGDQLILAREEEEDQ